MLSTAMQSISPAMSAPHQSYHAANVAEKVLRRVEIAKVARNLQDCLALASFKAQNGWQDRTLRAIEPEVTEHLKRKRPNSNGEISSDSSSTTSDNGHYTSSPPTAHDFSSSRSDSTNPNQLRFQPSSSFNQPQNLESRKRMRSNSMTGNPQKPSRSTSWKQSQKLSQSSPVKYRTQPTIGLAPSSFVSESAAFPETHIEHSPLFDIHNTSDGEDTDLPVHSFQRTAASNMLSSSPPHTPPPNRNMRNDTPKQSGADLLLYLANSPSRSPGVSHARLPTISQQPPSTPPSQHSNLPSSVMNTPGATISLFNGALNTPGQGFNFADFVNVTPSPAQLPWGGRTPVVSKTPAATRAARRGLNFDALNPSSGPSPNMQRKTPTTQGLALELGEELMPRS